MIDYATYCRIRLLHTEEKLTAGQIARQLQLRCRSRKLTRECSGKVIKWGERGGGVSLSKEVGPEADGVDL
jgi:hypothetical protein